MTNRREVELPPPPDNLPDIFDFPAETIPPLRDRPPMQVPEGVSDRRDLQADRGRALLSARATERLLGQAAASPDVKKLLGRSFVPIGVRQLSTKDGLQTVALFYSYSNQWSVEANADPRGAVLSCQNLRQQPALAESEIEVAVSIARRALRADVGELSAGVMAISREEPEDPLAGRRLADVRFFDPTERLPRYFAIVDLAVRRVVESGRV